MSSGAVGMEGGLRKSPFSGELAGIEHPFKITVDVGERENVEGRPEMVPEVSLAPELRPELLIDDISQLENLMHEEGEEVQKEEVEGKMRWRPGASAPLYCPEAVCYTMRSYSS